MVGLTPEQAQASAPGASTSAEFKPKAKCPTCHGRGVALVARMEQGKARSRVLICHCIAKQIEKRKTEQAQPPPTAAQKPVAEDPQLARSREERRLAAAEQRLAPKQEVIARRRAELELVRTEMRALVSEITSFKDAATSRLLLLEEEKRRLEKAFRGTKEAASRLRETAAELDKEAGVLEEEGRLHEKRAQGATDDLEQAAKDLVLRREEIERRIKGRQVRLERAEKSLSIDLRRLGDPEDLSGNQEKVGPERA